MKNDGQPIRDSVLWDSRRTKDTHWLNNVFLFCTEIWAEQLKKHPVVYWLWNLVAGSDILLLVLMCLVTGRPIEQPFGQNSDQSTGLFATRWPIDNLLPLTLFSGTGGWRRGGWTRFSWMLPCLLLGARSPNFLKCVSDTIRVIRYTLTCWTRRGQWQEQGKSEWGQDRPQPMPVCHHYYYYYCLLFLILESIRT